MTEPTCLSVKPRRIAVLSDARCSIARFGEDSRFSIQHRLWYGVGIAAPNLRSLERLGSQGRASGGGGGQRQQKLRQKGRGDFGHSFGSCLQRWTNDRAFLPSLEAKGGLDSDVDSLLQQLEASNIAAEHPESLVRCRAEASKDLHDSASC